MKDLFELSLCNQKIQNVLYDTCYYWNNRVQREFGIISHQPNNMRTYIEEYDLYRLLLDVDLYGGTISNPFIRGCQNGKMI